MSTTVKTQQELYDIYKNEVLALAPDFTDFSEGSMHDILAGAISMATNEIQELIITEFSKTFFALASGDDLDRLAVDHFGDSFARPLATFSTGEVTFSRPSNTGNVVIPAGTIVKTLKNANGLEFRFETNEEVTMTGLSISVAVTCKEAGKAGNVNPAKIIIIESSLTDSSITVSNSASTAGGVNTYEDAEYRDFITQKILSLAGATELAIKGAAKSVAGVSFAEVATEERTVIDYDIGSSGILSGATFFKIPYPVLYIADANGNSSQGLIGLVKEAVFKTKACGVKIETRGAVPLLLNWSGSIVLNPSGPNYSELQVDTSKIVDTMKEYINKILAIGQSFSKINANAYVLSIWGSAGTNDLVSFSSSVPSGDVAVASNEKLISGTVEII